MQWDKGTETLLNGWLQSQQKLWGNWWDVMAGSTQNGHPGPVNGGAANGTASHGQPAALNFNPMFEVWQSMAEGWRNYLQQSVDAFAPQLSDGVRQSMAQFMASQQQTQQLLRMSTEAWQAMVATASSPAEWQTALTSYLEAMRQQLTSGFNISQMTQNSSELWQIYSQELQKVTQPWLALWFQGAPFGVSSGQPKGSSALADMTNLYWDAVNQSAGRMANIPSIGLTRELNEKVNRGFLYWQDNQRVNAEYQQLLLNTMVDAFAAFMQKLLAMAQAGQPIESQQKLLSLWVEVADAEFLKLFHSEHYAAVQSRYVNSSMAPIVSFDLPSGLDTTSGELYTPHIRAAATMALGLPKVGLPLAAKQGALGDLYLADVGIPPQLYAQLGLVVPLLFADGSLVGLTVRGEGICL